MSTTFRQGTSTVTMAGVTIGEPFCGQYQVCLGCNGTTNGPAPETAADMCGHEWVYTGGSCTEYDPSCVPVWYIDAIIARWEPVCSGLPTGGIPFDWPFEIPDYITTPGPPNMLMCHMLECLQALTGRKGTEECYTIEDFQGTEPGGVDESTWDGCYGAFLLLLSWWESHGARLVAEHCMGLDLGDLYPMGRIIQKATLHFYGSATEPTCEDVESGVECDECP